MAFISFDMFSYSNESYEIKGNNIGTIPNEFTKKIIETNTSFYLMDKNSITIYNPSTIYIQRVCKNCYNFGCLKSEICFRLFINENVGYFQEVKNSLIHKIQDSDMLLNNFPYQAMYFIHFDYFKNTFDPFGDPDFEIMFSRITDTFIGSFKENNIYLNT